MVTEIRMEIEARSIQLGVLLENEDRADISILKTRSEII